MTDPIDDENEEAERRKKKGDSGEGDSDSWGRGKAGAGAAAGAVKLSSQKDKEVKSEHRHLMAGELISAITEFFSALPMRASANLSVNWEKTKTNVKSFAIVNWVLEFGDKAVRELARTRERGASRDTRGLQRKTAPKVRPGINMKLDPSGPNGPTGQ
jgi:hypothetical protein